MGIEQKAEVMEIIESVSCLKTYGRQYFHHRASEYLKEFGDSITECTMGARTLSVTLDESLFTKDGGPAGEIFPSTVEGLKGRELDCDIRCGRYSLALRGLPYHIGAIFRGEDWIVSIYKEEFGPRLTPADLGREFVNLVRAGDAIALPGKSGS